MITMKSALFLTLNKYIFNSSRIANSFRVDYERTNFGKFDDLRLHEKKPYICYLYNSIDHDS